ncbi:MAG: hypothetical protein KIS62_19790 [Ramlibacter sp.]|nr:hypothetical protein [Ramlibacter sp.]
MDFLAHRRRARQWVFAGLVSLVFFCTGVIRVWLAAVDVHHARAANETVRRALGKAAPGNQGLTPDSRAANRAHVSKILQQDWNKMFSTIENMNPTETTLLGVSADGETGSIRLVYRLGSLAAVSMLTAQLNAGYDAPPWVLESAGGFRAARSAAARDMTSQELEATWSGKLQGL